MKILLVSNYENDRQESMLRFAMMLETGLKERGLEVERISPRPFFGLIKRSATGAGKWLGYLDKFVLFPRQLTRKIAEAGSDCVVHVCDHSNAFYTRYLQKVPHLVTCNDMLAVRSALGEFSRNRTGFTGKQLQRWIVEGLRRAERITCISEATKNDVLRITGKEVKIDVTPMGVNPAFLPMEKSKARQIVEKITGFSAPYLLHVGGNQWYKNRLGVLSLFEELRAGARKLILVGPPFDVPMQSYLDAHPAIAENVVSLHEVSNETLRALYAAAELLLFPSFEEGFGWPIVEAQACGCRVVTTGKAPMTEVGGDAAFYIPPDFVPGEAAKVVENALGQNKEEREASVERGIRNAARFTVEQMMQRYVAIYRELLYKS